MDYLHAFSIGAAGMALERTRVEAAAMNLAHAHAAQDPGAPAFQPLQVLAVVAEPFDGTLALARAQVLPAAAAWRRVHEPGHALADAQGWVAYPAVDPAREMVALLSALRAYEANVAAMSTARALALKTLEIGRQP